MAKIKYKTMSQMEFNKYYASIMIFSHSLENPEIVIRQFNNLAAHERKKIAAKYNQLEAVSKEKCEAGNEEMYLLCLMVNFNIIATHYNIDPATVCMCVTAPCNQSERIQICQK